MRRHNWTIRQPAQHVNVPSVQCNKIPATRFSPHQQPLDFHCSQGRGRRKWGWVVHALYVQHPKWTTCRVHSRIESSGLSVPGWSADCGAWIQLSFLQKVNLASFAVGRCLCCISFFLPASFYLPLLLLLLFLFDFIAFAFVFTI